MHVISVVNQKGGVGKTTSTVNIAAYLARANKRVLVIDLDPQANTTSGLGIDPSTVDTSIADVLFDPQKVSDAIVVQKQAGISLLPANISLADAEINLVSELSRELRLKTALERLDFDVILIDCPPALGLLTVNALAASQWVLIPVQAEYYALEGLTQLLDTMQRVRQAINPQLSLLGVLITMYDKRTSLSTQVEAELKKHFGDKLFEAVVPRNVRLAEAPSHGKTIADHDKWSRGARAYKLIAKELLNRVG